MLKKIGIAGAVVFASMSVPAFANETMVALNNGAKMKVAYPSGDTLRVEFRRDGTFETDDGRTGMWTLDGNILCQKVSSDGTEGCTTLAPDKKVGDTWGMVDIFGNDFVASLE